MKKKLHLDIQSQVIVYLLMSAIVITIVGDHALQPIEYIKVEKAEALSTPVLIEAEPDWTSTTTVVRKVLEAFPDAPIMVDVARCESGWDAHAHNAKTNDVGIMQINLPSHQKHARAMGLDVENNPSDNIKYARMLYDEAGLKPWSASRPCWSKK